MREITIHIRLPESRRGRWLLGVTILGLSAVVYAAVPNSFFAGDPLGAKKVNDNFTYLTPVANKMTVNALASVINSASPNDVAGLSVTVTTPGGKGAFLASFSGQQQLLGSGPGACFGIKDTTTSSTSGSLLPNGGCNGNDGPQTVPGYATASVVWLEPVTDGSATAHTFILQSTVNGTTTSYKFWGDLTVVWLPQP